MVDVIIPAFNAHDTIKKALLSICLQDVRKDIKVYIIDDCSDEPYDYLKEEFKDYLDITIYRLDKNSGPGVARNKGLEISNSELIMFLDADDEFINQFSVSALKNSIKDFDLEIGILEVENEDGSITYYNNHDRCLHGKMYRRSILDKYDIRFNNSYRHEDSSFHELYLFTNPRTQAIEEYVYLYRYKKGSLTRNKKEYEEFKNYKSYIDNALWAAEQGKEKKLNKYLVEEMVINSVVYLYYEYQNYYNEDYSKELIDWIKPLVLFYIEHNELIDQDKHKRVMDWYKSNFVGEPYITFDEFIDLANK